MQGSENLTHPQSAVQNRKADIRWPSVIQFGLSLLALLSLWGLALPLAIVGVVQYFEGPELRGGGLAALLMAAGLAASGLLLVPSAAYALADLIGRPFRIQAPLTRALRPILLIFALPVVLLLGYWVSEIDSLAWVVLPGIHVLAIGLPIVWLAALGLRALPSGRPQRAWGLFSSGLVIAPILALAAETIALLLLLFTGIVWISSQPELAEELTRLAQRLTFARNSPEALLRILGPYLAQPAVIYTALAFMAGVVPLIEEAVKPIGLWFLIRRPLTPAEGFTAGILSGAGFALFESLALSSSAEEWTLTVLTRIGAAVIHILLTGLSGWALVLAWREGRYLRLGLTYLAVAAVHGLWNGLAVAFAFNSLLAEMERPRELPVLSHIGSLAPYLLAGLALFGLAALLWANRSLRRSQENEE